MTEVSRPPEYAKTTFLGADISVQIEIETACQWKHRSTLLRIRKFVDHIIEAWEWSLMQAEIKKAIDDSISQERPIKVSAFAVLPETEKVLSYITENILEKYENGEFLPYETPYGKGFFSKENHEKCVKYDLDIHSKIEVTIFRIFMRLQRFMYFYRFSAQ